MNNLYENLSEPGPVGKNVLRVVPLGGLGEVGRNMGKVRLTFTTSSTATITLPANTEKTADNGVA